MHIELYDTDYVLFKDGKPLESLDIIYGQSAIQELYDNGFKLEKGEEFVKMTDLPKEWKQKYINKIKERKYHYENKKYS
jgi:hypothetical protein